MSPPQGSRWLPAAFVIASVHVSVCVAQAPIVGTWQGTSTCADKVAFPACNDEVVVYVVSALGAASDSVTLRADKLVGDAREFMGELLFGKDSSGAWHADLRTARYRGRWTLTIDGDRMTGILVDLPSGQQVRHVSLRRVPD
jgi:hypothetical protein